MSTEIGKDDKNKTPNSGTIKGAIIGGVLGIVAAVMAQAYNHHISNQPPQAVIEAEEPPKATTDNRLEVYKGMILKFNASKSKDDSDGESSLKFTWKLEHDGQIVDEKEKSSKYEKILSEIGSYTLTLVVEDSQRKDDSDSFRINVRDTSFAVPGESKKPLTSNSWWQPWNESKGIPPEGALIVDYEEENLVQHEPLFLCRALDEGLLKPGKVLSSGVCMVPRYTIKDGTVDPEHSTRPSIDYQNYEIFVPQGAWSWVEASNRKDFNNVVSSDENNKDKTMICRVKYGQRNTEGNFRVAKHPGILDTSINHCIFPWGEVSGYRDINNRSDTYDVLTAGF